MLSYQELLKLNQKLTAENDLLKKENADLRKQLHPIKAMPSTDIPPNPKVHNHSPAQEKIDLFSSLFQGRTDVYAKRWHSANLQKSGYQPVCAHEWDRVLCDKRKFKCNICPNRSLVALNNQALENHLRGDDSLARDVIGIYPLLTDETCLFLAVDFDGDGFMEDVLAFKKSCQENQVPVAIERSRSGNGAHAWIFFADNISATLARKMGSGLLTFAFDLRSELKFSSYDRLFPSQDLMPAGGFGNLIALPLQGQARKNDNSIFVDDNFIAYPDQWAYLSTIKKMTLVEVENIVQRICQNGELGELITDSEESSQPWQNNRQSIAISSHDFPADGIEIIKSNMLYIKKDNIRTQALNKIKRLATFKNPDFYKAQAMRLPTYNKPRLISLAENSDDYLALPRGAENALSELLDSLNVKFTISDKTNHGQAITAEFNGTLRENQIPAVNELLKHDIGVLAATTAFDKTVIAAHLIAARKANTLVLVHTQALLNQWHKSLSEFLQISHDLPEQPAKRGRKKKPDIIGRLGGGKDNLQDIVDIAIMQSLFKDDEVKDLVRNYGQIIVDECHHVSAVNFEKILRFATAKYICGLTATPIRQDGQQAIIFLQCGEIRYKVDAKAEAFKRPFEHFILPRFTNTKKFSLKDESQISQVYNDLSINELRNRYIVNDIVTAIENNRKPIVLTERTDHIKILAKMLEGKCDNIFLLYGGLSAKEKKEIDEQLQQLPADSKFVIIAGGRYVGEGFDFPRLDTLMLAMPIAWQGKVAQYAGRLHRAYEGKIDVLIYDYVDLHIPVLERMYHKRVKSYAALGYKTLDMPQNIDKSGIIYDERTFFPVFTADIIQATKEIVIFSPFMNKNRVRQMAKELSGAILNGVVVTIITRPVEDYAENIQNRVLQNAAYLQEANIKVEYRSAIHQKFAVIDQHIVWYGSINFLSFGKAAESVMRLESFEIGGELLGL